MDDILKQIVGIVPEKWRSTLTLLVVLSPFIGRAFQSLRNGGGLKGFFASIWLGTNTPKPQPPTEPKP